MVFANIKAKNVKDAASIKNHNSLWILVIAMKAPQYMAAGICAMYLFLDVNGNAPAVIPTKAVAITESIVKYFRNAQTAIVPI